ncbi:hypothetical protein SAMN05216223_10333 [Actinacidiphila yanglinensis]|uniref:Transmembrane protein n=1 Tax=Actinacidiphila yanglinensis TaxID=310779 RepID=A0A1H5X025_9ACTN|nr:hypothetical protein SAMN05216223_10333 [Actinacidiphila yanglinensis]
MAAGPRDTPHGRDTSTDSNHFAGDPKRNHHRGQVPESRPPLESLDAPNSPSPSHDPVDPLDPLGTLEPLDGLESLDQLDRLEPLGVLDDLDPLESAALLPAIEDGESFGELRPQRRLRIWQIAPIIALAVGGSLMFAFPLAFESGDTGPVVAMLGLLLCCCAAGWGLAAARRIGQTWPGLPARGSGGRADWRYVAGYTALTVVLALLAVWRVARLR